MEEAPELISPRISFSHDLATATTTTPATQPAQPSRSDTSLMLRGLPEPEFDFANAAAADVAPADRLFADGKLLPVPPLPPSPNARSKPNPCKHQARSCIKPQACQKRPGTWASPFSRSSSVNSAATTAPRSASGRFSCPSFPLMRSRSTGSAAAAQDGLGSIEAAGHRPPHKKVGATTAASNGASTRSVYYYGGSRNGTASHGVRVSPILNVPSIGTSVVNVLSYLLCDCGSNKATKSRGFGVNC